jgi:hypothetical protein
VNDVPRFVEELVEHLRASTILKEIRERRPVRQVLRGSTRRSRRP